MRERLPLLAVVVGLCATACGDRETVSKDEFAGVADAICARANEKVGRRPLAGDTFGIDEPSAYRRVLRYYANFVATERAALDELRAREVPREDRQVVARFLSAFARMIRYAEESLEALRARDLEEFRDSTRVRELYRLSAQVELRAAAYGFEDCTQLGIR